MLQGDQYEYVYGGPAGGAFSTDSLHLASEVVKVSWNGKPVSPASSLAAFQRLRPGSCEVVRSCQVQALMGETLTAEELLKVHPRLPVTAMAAAPADISNQVSV